MRRFVAFNRTSWDHPKGVFVMHDPRCTDFECPEPGTKRITLSRRGRVYWSLPWCPEHAHAFRHPERPLLSTATPTE